MAVVIGPSAVDLTMRGVGSPARPLDPGEDARWVGVTPFERVRIAARTVKRLRG